MIIKNFGWRLSLPILIFGTLILILGALAAVYVHHEYQRRSDYVARQFAGLSALQNLFVAERDVRYYLREFLLRGDATQIEAARELRKASEQFTDDAESLAVTDTGKELLRRIREGDQGDFREMALIGALGNIYFNFDEKRRCHSIKSTAWSIDIPSSGFDTSGNVVAFTSTDCLGTYAAAFDYDEKNQLTAEHGSWQDQYTYDARGNRISADPINILDQLNDLQSSYDLCGNVVSKTVHGKQTLYHYDALDRLSAVEIPNATTAVYTYDAFHRRLTKKQSVWDSTTNRWIVTNTLRFLYDGEKEIGVVDNQGKLIELRVLGTGTMGTGQHSDIGAAVAIELDGKVYAPIHDFRGNVCCLLSHETGKTVENYRYSAFGKAQVLSPDGNVLNASALHNPWMFSSKRLDTETGLVYYGNRYYDPEAGRWTTKDPLGTFDGLNPYIFLHNNPLYSIDLTGLFSWSSAWDSAAYFMHAVKKKVSFTENIKEELDTLAHATFSKTFLQLSGYYEHQADSGRSVHGEEFSDQVRITLINGILNVKMDLEETLKLFSKTHGDTAIHYVFHPTEGWSKDMINSILAKFGYTTPYAQLLAHKWKELIKEIGTDGTIIHYAHSTGATDTYVAKNLLSPEEQQMIHVITLGSPILIPNGVGFGSTINYVSKRDGVCLLDPIGYINGLVSEESNVEFLGTFWGIPIIDHTLYTETYGNMIKDLGDTFKSKFGSERS